MCKLVPIKTNYGEEVLVADIKKDFIEKIIRSAENCPIIDKIMLFGSSITNRCKEGSDVDFAVFSTMSENDWLLDERGDFFIDALYADDIENNLSFQDIDMIYVDSNIRSNSLLSKEIDNGIKIYERG